MFLLDLLLIATCFGQDEELGVMRNERLAERIYSAYQLGSPYTATTSTLLSTDQYESSLEWLLDCNSVPLSEKYQDQRMALQQPLINEEQKELRELVDSLWSVLHRRLNADADYSRKADAGQKTPSQETGSSELRSLENCGCGADLLKEENRFAQHFEAEGLLRGSSRHNASRGVAHDVALIVSVPAAIVSAYAKQWPPQARDPRRPQDPNQPQNPDQQQDHTSGRDHNSHQRPVFRLPSARSQLFRFWIGLFYLRTLPGEIIVITEGVPSADWRCFAELLRLVRLKYLVETRVRLRWGAYQFDRPGTFSREGDLTQEGGFDSGGGI